MSEKPNGVRRRWFFTRTICLALLLAAAAGAVLGYRFWHLGEMLRATLDWGRLAPLPASTHDFIITAEGSMFTRAFLASFAAPIADVDDWLRDSPGTHGVIPERPLPASRRYLIVPGGGAAHADVTVEEISGLVQIYVYWS